MQGAPETRTLFCLLATSIFSILVVLASSRLHLPLSSSYSSAHLLSASHLLSSDDGRPSPPPPPTLAYLLSGTSSDSDRLLRLLLAVYHPNNLYLLLLDRSAPDHLRRHLALSIQSLSLSDNVHVVGRPGFVDPHGSSALASTLHAAAILLRLSSRWDWFINLSASDYPLLPQDDLLHVLSFVPKDLNFIQHSSHIGWRESRRLRRIIVDPELYQSSKSDVFYATQKRDLPNAYRIFSGSASVILSRKIVEHCILGTDNLPRTLLMYYANIPASQTNYFQTMVCNSEFNGTIVNYNMHYVLWDSPPKSDPRPLGILDFQKMVQSGAAFGTEFHSDDPVLDHIDREILNRSSGKVAPGGWCLGEGDDPCSVWGDTRILRPGSGAKRLERALVELLSNATFRSQQCISE